VLRVRPWAAVLVEGQERGGGSAWAEERRSAVGRALDRGARSPEGRRVLRALILGESRGLPPRLREAFSRTGTAHLLAISGLHVGLVAGVVAMAVRRATRWVSSRSTRDWALDGRLDLAALALAVGVAGAYVLLASAPVSSRRAWWMLMAAGVALACGRKPVGWNVVAVGAIALAWTDPVEVVSVGSGLSFAAVVGLLAASPSLDRVGAAVPRVLRRVTVLGCVSVVAMIATAPLVAGVFGRVPLAGAWVNIVAVPAFALLLPPALLGGAIGMVWETGGATLVGLSAVGLEVVLDVIRWFAAPQRSPMVAWEPSGFVMAAIYATWGMLLVCGGDET
jgi:competence protein ComEC